MSEPTYVRATREAYDIIAHDYVKHFHGELEIKPYGRAMLNAFAELVRGSGVKGLVADIGCGAGPVTGYLHSRGLEVFGVDLSTSMVELARVNHPALRFDVGSMNALAVEDEALAGLVAWYSVIHTPVEQVSGVACEFHRVLAPGGYLLLAFQVGDQPLHFDEAFGHAVNLDFHRYAPDLLEKKMTAVGFAVEARLLRERDATERVPQAHLIFRKPANT